MSTCDIPFQFLHVLGCKIPSFLLFCIHLLPLKACASGSLLRDLVFQSSLDILPVFSKPSVASS